MSTYYSVSNSYPSIPVVANIPHSSTCVPDFARKGISASEDLFRLEMLRLTDWYTDELYSSVARFGGCAVTFGANRLVLDPERFEDDGQEMMSQAGMGVIYTRGTHGDIIRETVSPEMREELLSKLYRPYHAELEMRVRWVLEHFGKCLFLDCHSFPEKTLPYELNQSIGRADFGFGSDDTHTPLRLLQTLEQTVGQAGFSSLRNEPFAGTIVPLQLYGDRRVASVMIEINRGLYMDENNGQKLPSFRKIQDVVSELVRAAIETV
ncbi:MAG: N-formylglutamate amidohydrolase [Deltaproteobacteria bacterium]|nr:N-formylglutamate amidohydrolase [Deltaproteobacteria bacterium]